MAETEARQDEAVPEIVARAHRWFREARDHSSGWRLEAETWYDMHAGKQWSDDDVFKLQDDKRPAVTFNRILRTVNAVVGTQVANRQETRFFPRELGDVEVNEVLTAAADWVRDNCDAEDEESDAFQDMTIAGMGWTETRVGYDENADGDILIDRIDPLEMYWDPAARKRNLSDGRWVMHVKMMPIDEFEAEWPDADLDIAGAPWEGAEDDISRRTHVYPQDAYKAGESQRTGGKRPNIRVAHVQWAERADAYRVGKRAERMDKQSFERLQPKLDEHGIGYMRQAQVTWKRAFIAGGAVLEEGDCPFPDGPTLRCMTYMRDRNAGNWFGIVKVMVDPQRFGNKFFSLSLDILNKGSKGGVMVEADAVDDFRELEAKWARSDSVIKFRPGALSTGKVKEKPLVQLPPDFANMMAFSLDAVHEGTGINLELLGMANRNQPGVLESHRKQAGLTIIAPLFDGMRRYRKEQGRVLLHMIQAYISDGRLIRILGDKGQEQYVPLAKQPGTARYDVIVDQAPTSPDMKEKVYRAIVEMMPALAKMGVPLPPELLDYSPLPSTVIAAWKKLIEESGGNPEEMQARLEQAGKEVQRLSGEVQKLGDKRQEVAAGLQLKGQANAEEMGMKRQDMEAEWALKREEAEREWQLKREEAEREFAIKAEMMERQSDLKRQEVALKHGVDADELALHSEPLMASMTAKLEEIAQQLAEHSAQMLALAAPKNIAVERDADGLFVGATVTPRLN